jgi:8-amino-7-oxononanoate synthase
MPDEEFLASKLAMRAENGSLRELAPQGKGVDFCSNDYLGLAGNEAFRRFLAREQSVHAWETGSTGSRLLSGNHPLFEKTERRIASFHHGEAALVFNSGYDANLGVLSAVPSRDDVIFYDSLIHASVRDGIRLSLAPAYSFPHNDPAGLEKRLSRVNKRSFVVVESIYSMDGDQAPLEVISALCRRYGAYLIVDEAHATGVTGPEGAGLVQELGLEDACFARVHTFGKALGVHGAAVVGSATLKRYLVNFARSFIFTTAMAPASVAAIGAAYEFFPAMEAERRRLENLIDIFQQAALPFEKLPSRTPIQAVVIPDNAAVRAVAGHLQAGGYYLKAVLHPTVPLGKERLRVVLHGFNTPQQVAGLIKKLSELAPLSTLP